MLLSRCDTVFHPLGRSIELFLSRRPLELRSAPIPVKDLLPTIREVDPYCFGKKSQRDIWQQIVHLSTITGEIVLPGKSTDQAFLIPPNAMVSVSHVAKKERKRKK